MLIASSVNWDSMLQSLNPVVWYKLHETSGTVATDYSSNSLNGTYNGTVTYAQSTGFTNVGTGFETASSTGGYITTTHNSVMDITGDLTIIAVINRGSASINFPKIVWMPTNVTSGTGTYLLSQNYSTQSGKFFFRETVSGSNTDVISTTIPTAGVGYVIFARRSSGVMSIWVNGTSEATASITGAADTGTLPLYIGSSNNSDSFGGIISNVAIYNYALSDTQLGNIYALR